MLSSGRFVAESAVLCSSCGSEGQASSVWRAGVSGPPSPKARVGVLPCPPAQVGGSRQVYSQVFSETLVPAQVSGTGSRRSAACSLSFPRGRGPPACPPPPHVAGPGLAPALSQERAAQLAWRRPRWVPPRGKLQNQPEAPREPLHPSLRAPLVTAPTAPTAPHLQTQPPQHPWYPHGGMWRSRAAPALRLPFAGALGSTAPCLRRLTPMGTQPK